MASEPLWLALSVTTCSSNLGGDQGAAVARRHAAGEVYPNPQGWEAKRRYQVTATCANLAHSLLFSAYERLKTVKARLIIIIAAMAVFGLAYQLRPAPHLIHRTEAWLQTATPTSVDGFDAVPGPQGEKQTYRMSDITYQTIQAYGIDSVVFRKALSNIDVCVIASNNRESFHDPSFCFPSQDWKILNIRTVSVPTKTRGTIPFSVMQAQPPNGANPVVAAYTYKGPFEMCPSQADMYLQWSKASFITGEPQEGAFYRFMGDGTTTEADLLKFAADYMDAVKGTSNGVL